jgi:hypothetical protein
LKHLYQAMKVSGHVFVSTFYWSTCTKPGKWMVMYLCQLVIETPVPSHESKQSCIYVNFLLKHLYQVRKVSGHVYVSTFYCSTCTKSGKWVVMYLCQLFNEAPVSNPGFFRGGILIVRLGWPVIGMCVEIYGFFLLFRYVLILQCI